VTGGGGTRKNPKRKNPTDAFLRGFLLLRCSTRPGCRRRARALGLTGAYATCNMHETTATTTTAADRLLWRRRRRRSSSLITRTAKTKKKKKKGKRMILNNNITVFR